MKPLEKIPELLADLQRDSEGKHQQVGEAIKNATQEMQRVQETTGNLKALLSGGKKRGEWGERVADDILTLAGFKENVNYFRHQQTQDGKKPDFTFSGS